MKFSRNLKNNIKEGLKYSPVVLINGARQSGKSTLAKELIQEGVLNEYISLDDPTVLGAITASPVSYLQNLPVGTVIDEIQRAPEVFTSIKHIVDTDRQKGRFLLTGSANVMLLPKLSDSLAGRIEVHTLRPFSQGEIEGIKEEFVDWLFSDNFDRIKVDPCSDLIKRVGKGGYPQPVVEDYNTERTYKWYQDYINTLLLRDVRDIANIEQIGLMPLLLKLLAGRNSNILNYNDISRNLSLPYTSLKRYMQLIETLYLIDLIPAWYKNQGKRLIKAPKVHLADTGFVLNLLGLDPSALARDRLLLGSLLENFVVLEIEKQLGWSKSKASVYHSRTQNQEEVDIVLEGTNGKVIALEVKASSTVDQKDIKNIRSFKELVGEKFHKGVVLYTGNEVHKIDDDLYFLPVQSLWQNGLIKK